jgi:hypothetical protein
MPRPQFSLRSLFVLTAIVAVGCWASPPIVREVRARWFPPKPLPGDLAAMTAGILPPVPVDDLCGWSWFGEGPMELNADQNDARLPASPPTD